MRGKKWFLWAVLSLLAFPSALGQASIIQGSFLDVYNKFAGWIDFLLYFLLFGLVTRLSLEKKWGESRVVSLLAVVLGLVLGLSLALWGVQAGFSIVSLGPWALVLFVVGVPLAWYDFKKRKEEPERGLLSGARLILLVLLLFLLVYLLYPNLLLGVGIPLVGDADAADALIGLVIVVSLIAAIIMLFRWLTSRLGREAEAGEVVEWDLGLVGLVGLVLGTWFLWASVGWWALLLPLLVLLGMGGYWRRKREKARGPDEGAPEIEERTPREEYPNKSGPGLLRRSWSWWGENWKKPFSAVGRGVKRIGAGIGEGWSEWRGFKVGIIADPLKKIYTLSDREIKLSAWVTGGSGSYLYYWDDGIYGIESSESDKRILNLGEYAEKKGNKFDVWLVVKDKVSGKERKDLFKFELMKSAEAKESAIPPRPAAVPKEPLGERARGFWGKLKEKSVAAWRRRFGLKIKLITLPHNIDVFAVGIDERILFKASVEEGGSGKYTYFWKTGLALGEEKRSEPEYDYPLNPDIIGMKNDREKRKVEVRVVDNETGFSGRASFKFTLQRLVAELRLISPQSESIIPYANEEIMVRFEIINRRMIHENFKKMIFEIGRGKQERERVKRRGLKKSVGGFDVMIKSEESKRVFVGRIPSLKLDAGEYTVALIGLDDGGYPVGNLLDVFFLKVAQLKTSASEETPAKGGGFEKKKEDISEEFRVKIVKPTEEQLWSPLTVGMSLECEGKEQKNRGGRMVQFGWYVAHGEKIIEVGSGLKWRFRVADPGRNDLGLAYFDLVFFGRDNKKRVLTRDNVSFLVASTLERDMKRGVNKELINILENAAEKIERIIEERVGEEEALNNPVVNRELIKIRDYLKEIEGDKGLDERVKGEVSDMHESAKAVLSKLGMRGVDRRSRDAVSIEILVLAERVERLASELKKIS